jgi:hypothetical protein
MSRERRRLADSRLPATVLGAGLAAIGAFLLAPTGSAAGLAAWSVPFLLSVLVLAARVVAGPPPARGPLLLLLGGQLLHVGASAF